MRTASIALILVALSVTACKPGDKAGKINVAAEEQAIRAKESAWMDAYNRHDADALASQYEADAALASNGASLMTDSVGRSIFLDAMAKDPNLKVDFGSDRIIVAASGELASSRGHYTLTYTDQGTKQPKTEKGSYLTVYRKGSDGKWLAVEDFTTPGQAVVPTAEATTTTP